MGDQSNRLRRLHGLSALAIGLFLLIHMGNHIVGLAGQQAHQDYMTAARAIYRQPLVEAALLALLIWQTASGVTLVVRGWRTRSGFVGWLQALSGLYLAFFLIAHVGAVLGGRYVLGLDTDFRFAAAGFFVPPWQFYFAPYYFLGLFCLFGHIGCAFYWILGDRAGRVALSAALILGTGLALAVVLALSGAFYEIDIPPAYKATYGA